MVVEDALHLVHGLLVGGNVDGLVEAPGQEGGGEGDVEA